MNEQRDKVLRQAADFLYRQGVGDGSAAIDDVLAENEKLRVALGYAEAERIALADAFRAELESRGEEAVNAAMWVQNVITDAAKRHRMGSNG